MKEADAKTGVNQALKNPNVRFHFDLDHDKGGKSKDRYRKYSRECRTLSDFRRLNGSILLASLAPPMIATLLATTLLLEAEDG